MLWSRAWPVPESEPMHQVHTDDAPAAIGPYSQAVISDGLLFTSGQIALSPDGSFIAGDVIAQAQQVFANLDAVLLASGCRRDTVVKATVYLADMADFPRVNEVYAEFFGAHRPARSTVQAAGLPKGAAIEIDLIARVP